VARGERCGQGCRPRVQEWRDTIRIGGVHWAARSALPPGPCDQVSLAMESVRLADLDAKKLRQGGFGAVLVPQREALQRRPRRVVELSVLGCVKLHLIAPRRSLALRPQSRRSHFSACASSRL
jgi:hypothetical protein